MWKYFTDRNTRKWINVLPQIVKNYNNSYNRSIKAHPKDVNVYNANIIYENLYPELKKV